MTTLAADKARAYELGDLQDLPMIAADIIYEGAAVGDNGSGLARPLAAADPFLGFAERIADNSAGAASAKNVRVRTRGSVVVAVTGAASAADVGEAVYASDDDTFSFSPVGGVFIGFVHRFISAGVALVRFDVHALRSGDLLHHPLGGRVGMRVQRRRDHHAGRRHPRLQPQQGTADQQHHGLRRPDGWLAVVRRAGGLCAGAARGHRGSLQRRDRRGVPVRRG